MPAENVSDNVAALIDMALAEDFGPGDVTSTYFVPEHLTARAIPDAPQEGRSVRCQRGGGSIPQGGPRSEGGSVPARRGGRGARRRGHAHRRVRPLHSGCGTHGPELHPAPFRRGFPHPEVRKGRFPHQRPHSGHPQDHSRLPPSGKGPPWPTAGAPTTAWDFTTAPW